MNNVNYHIARNIAETSKAQKEQEQEQATRNFLSESHELTDARDLNYWMEQTGKDLHWLLDHSNNMAPNIINPLKMGATLDDIWTTLPEHPRKENECI